MAYRLAAVLMLCGMLVCTGAEAETRACAHRGDVAVAPENTLPAFASAVRKGASMIEFDVAVTRDGKLVIMHDSTVNRTTNGAGKVQDLGFDEIRALDAGTWFDAEFAGAQVPTLRETLHVIPKTILCNVHLKRGEQLAAKTARVIQEMGRLDHCFLACSIEQAAEARAEVPEVKICNMSRQSGDRNAYIASTLEHKAEFIQLHHGQGMNGLKEDVNRLHKKGVTVNWFGASTEAPIRALAQAGVDYILTDDLDLCLEVLTEIGKTSK